MPHDELGPEERSAPAAHQHRPHDPPEEHPMLILPRHREERKDDRDDKDVVHRQRKLDDVPRQVLLCRLEPASTFPRTIGESPGPAVPLYRGVSIPQPQPMPLVRRVHKHREQMGEKLNIAYETKAEELKAQLLQKKKEIEKLETQLEVYKQIAGVKS